jgi:hypothetical protein
LSRDRAAAAPYPPSNVPNTTSTRQTRNSRRSNPEKDDDDVKEDRRRITRSSKPNCSVYGTDRYLWYPGYKFCQNCTFYDNAVAANELHHASHKDSRLYRCRSEHKSWCFPTQKIIPHHILLAKEDSIFKKKHAGKKHRNGSELSKSESSSSAYSSEPLSDSEPSNSDSDTPTEHDDANDKQSNIHQGSTPSATSNDESLTETATTRNKVEGLLKEIQLLHEQLIQKNCRIEMLDQRLKLKHQKCRRLEKMMGALPDTHLGESQDLDVKGKEQVIRHTIRVLTGLKIHPRTNRRIITKRIAKELFCDVLFGGLLKKEFMLLARKEIRLKIYTPVKVLRMMDLKGGQVNYTSIASLREIDTEGQKFFSHCILPSEAELKRTAKVVEFYGQNKACPWTHGHVKAGGEFVEFKVQDVITMMLVAFGLEAVAKHRPVLILQAIDGSHFSKRDHHVTYGLKAGDKASLCPITRQPLFASQDRACIQTRNACFPVKIVLGKETKQMYKEFKPLFDILKGSENGEDPENNLVCGLLPEEFKPLKIGVNCDYSAVWKGLDRGGAVKRFKLPCTCCAIKDAELIEPKAVKCERWCNNRVETYGDSWKCYHQDFLTERRKRTMQVELEQTRVFLEEIADRLEQLAEESQIRIDEDPRGLTGQGNSTNDNMSIHYNLEGRPREEIRAYSNRIVHDLLLRNIEIVGVTSATQRRTLLRNSLIQEFTYRNLKDAIAHGQTGTENALFLLINAVPCILHMENRIGIKILTRLFMKGLGYAKEKKLPTPLTEDGRELSESKRIEHFLKTVQTVLNTNTWGSEESPSQWECPYDPKAKQIDTISLDNGRTRKAINDFEALVEVCFYDNGEKASWTECISHYRKSMEIARLKDDLTDEDIETYQEEADLFFQQWIDLNGRAGITNYIHLMGAGHIAEYMFHWRNLYQHSQQSWEAFNSLLKTFYFRRTGRGGASNRGKGEKTKLKPVARWIQRRMIWMCNVSYELMLEFYKNGIVLRDDEQSLGDANDDIDDIHAGGDRTQGDESGWI